MRGIQWLGACLGVVLLVVFLLLPPFEPLTGVGMKIVGVFLLTVFWWIFVDVGFSSFLCITLLAVTGILTTKEAFAASMGSWLPLFLIGSFGLSEAVSLSGFSQRFAMWFLTRPIARGRPWLLLALFFLSVTIFGAVMSSTVTTIVFTSIAIPMLEGIGYKKGDRFAATLIMGVAWAATASFIMTPIGHGSNMLGIEWIQRDTGYPISFTQWMAVGIPVGLLAYLLSVAFFRYIIRPDVHKFSSMANDYILREAGKLEPVKREEKITLGIFFGVLILWILPSIAGRMLPGVSEYLENLGFAIPPLIGAILLCIITVRNKPLLTFRQWMTGVEWGSVVLVAAIMVIGEVIVKPGTGIPDLLTRAIQPIVTGAPFFVVVLVSAIWVVLQTNLMSNLVSATVVYSIMMPAVIAAGTGNPVALGYLIFGGCHYAYSLPSATTSTAIVIGSGWVPVPFMARYGVALILPIVLLLALVCYPLASLVLR